MDSEIQVKTAIIGSSILCPGGEPVNIQRLHECTMTGYDEFSLDSFVHTYLHDLKLAIDSISTSDIEGLISRVYSQEKRVVAFILSEMVVVQQLHLIAQEIGQRSFALEPLLIQITLHHLLHGRMMKGMIRCLFKP